uniref:Zinc finger, CCHC-type n=1 Tax=Tanacetum cinerariifolium TaxID=118510 RepID=A0A6L2M6K9_TANCI|nr:hypothetical protein [Tanacetum cinerariifolium]
MQLYGFFIKKDSQVMETMSGVLSDAVKMLKRRRYKYLRRRQSSRQREALRRFGGLMASGFIRDAEKSLGELHSMLNTAKTNVLSKQVVLNMHMIMEGDVRKNNKSYSEGKRRSKGKQKISLPPKKESTVNNAECFYCGKI